MHSSLDLFQTAHAMARHAGARQAVVARNIANADTPGFQAQQVAAFKDAFDGLRSDGAMRTTRPGHMQAADIPPSTVKVMASAAEPAPNGNNVSIEEELLNSVSVAREHNRALTIYRHTLTVLRNSLGRT